MNEITSQEYDSILRNHQKIIEIVNLFEKSPEYKQDQNLMSKLINQEIPNVSEYFFSDDHPGFLIIFHCALLNNYIFFGKSLPTDNRRKLCRLWTLSITSAEYINQDSNFHKDFFYGALFVADGLFFTMVTESQDDEIFQLTMENNLKWFNTSLLKSLWIKEYIKTFENKRKEDFELAFGDRYELSEDMFNEISQRIHWASSFINKNLISNSGII